MPITRAPLVASYLPCRAKWGIPNLAPYDRSFEKSIVPVGAFFSVAQWSSRGRIPLAYCQQRAPFRVLRRNTEAFRSFTTLPQCEGVKACGDETADRSNEERDKEAVQKILNRYSNLRPEDRRRILDEHMKNTLEGAGKVSTYESLKEDSVDQHLMALEKEKHARIEQKRRATKLLEMLKPAHLRRRRLKTKRVHQLEDEEPAVVSASFTHEMQTLSLVEDRHKAEVYEEICTKLRNQYKATDPLSDQFYDVMTQALREELMDQSRPVLENEFTDFDNPYMLKHQALKRLLEERCTRNALEESMIPLYLERRADLTKMRLYAKLPPEAVEPLIAFFGLTNYNFDKRTRLQQKVEAVATAVETLADGAELEEVLDVLPENQPSDRIHENHPFKNHFGFESAVPWGTVGSITAGREKPAIERELAKLRYPTLQRVAHSLPKDPKYRASVAHAIRLLERAKGWDFESKLKAISTLIEVYNNLPPSSYYDKQLEKAFPVFRQVAPS